MPIQHLHRVLPASEKAPLPSRPLAQLVSQTLDTFDHLAKPQSDETVATIEVHETISQVAFVYEKLRQAIDYQDEHLLRKNAIERILKRRLVGGATAEQIAEPMVRELIRSRYLPNDAVPTTTVDRCVEVMNQYIHLWANIPHIRDTGESRRLYEWYLGLMSVELSELLVPAHHNEALVKLMFNTVHQDIVFASDELSEAEKDALLYIAIHRALLKADTNILRYHLFLGWHPEWRDPTPANIAAIGQQLPELRLRIESQILHPAGELLQRLMKKYAIIFLIFDDIVEKYGSEARENMSQPEVLVEDIKEAYTSRRKKVTGKITRSIVRSIVYVFITKMLIALLVEVPLDRLFTSGPVDYMPLAINVGFPPLLLLFLGVTIRPPGKKNEEGVIEKVEALVYRSDQHNALVKPRKPLRRSSLFAVLYRIIYSLTFIVVFGGIIWALQQFNFTPFSTGIFIFFLTIVSFFGIRVRLLAKELVVVDQRENFFTILFDFFTVPILQVGRWIAMRAPKVNLLIYFFDVIIEAPFKAFLEAVEGFVGFLREKREEIY